MSIETRLPLGEVAPVGLAEVVGAARLARRVDRKYLVPVGDAARLVRLLADSHRVLRIGGRGSTSYRSTYLDTADLRLCRDHLQGRRLRWKARSRLYVEDRLCRFEVKVKGSRGETVKHTLDLPAEEYGGFGPAERAFLAEVLGDLLTDRRGVQAHLRPVLEVAYSRATLVDLAEGTRLTLDHGVVGRSSPLGTPGLASGLVAFDPDLVVVETKSPLRPGGADRLLADMGHRPLPLSKYTTAAALLADGVPDNDVRRLVGRAVVVHHDLDQEAS